MIRPRPPRLLAIGSTASLAPFGSTNDESTEDTQMQEGSSTWLARDSTVAAYAHQFKKVLELSEVVIQVLDARDPMSRRSRLVEDELKRAGGDKTMIRALNKTDLVPKENDLAWLRYLRPDFPSVPLESSPGSKHHSESASSSSASRGTPKPTGRTPPSLPAQILPTRTYLLKNSTKNAPTPPTVSIATTSNLTYEPGSDGRHVKAPNLRRTQYNPNAPIVFDTDEIESIANANPLNQKRQNEQRKREEDGMLLDAYYDDAVEMQLEAEMEAKSVWGLQG